MSSRHVWHIWHLTDRQSNHLELSREPTRSQKVTSSHYDVQWRCSSIAQSTRTDRTRKVYRLWWKRSEKVLDRSGGWHEEEEVRGRVGWWQCIRHHEGDTSSSTWCVMEVSHRSQQKMTVDLDERWNQPRAVYSQSQQYDDYSQSQSSQIVIPQIRSSQSQSQMRPSQRQVPSSQSQRQAQSSQPPSQFQSSQSQSELPSIDIHTTQSKPREVTPTKQKSPLKPMVQTKLPFGRKDSVTSSSQTSSSQNPKKPTTKGKKRKVGFWWRHVSAVFLFFIGVSIFWSFCRYSVRLKRWCSVLDDTQPSEHNPCVPPISARYRVTTTSQDHSSSSNDRSFYRMWFVDDG